MYWNYVTVYQQMWKILSHMSTALISSGDKKVRNIVDIINIKDFNFDISSDEKSNEIFWYTTFCTMPWLVQNICVLCSIKFIRYHDGTKYLIFFEKYDHTFKRLISGLKSSITCADSHNHAKIKIYSDDDLPLVRNHDY